MSFLYNQAALCLWNRCSTHGHLPCVRPSFLRFLSLFTSFQAMNQLLSSRARPPLNLDCTQLPIIIPGCPMTPITALWAGGNLQSNFSINNSRWPRWFRRYGNYKIRMMFLIFSLIIRTVPVLVVLSLWNFGARARIEDPISTKLHSRVPNSWAPPIFINIRDIW